ncbi:hypothetical protein Ddc_14332 [Ditylenchus destructor]|nr:hypothetical protein Ddc_14332 [Ditylenchus destructor]
MAGRDELWPPNWQLASQGGTKEGVAAESIQLSPVGAGRSRSRGAGAEKWPGTLDFRARGMGVSGDYSLMSFCGDAPGHQEANESGLRNDYDNYWTS